MCSKYLNKFKVLKKKKIHIIKDFRKLNEEHYIIVYKVYIFYILQ